MKGSNHAIGCAFDINFVQLFDSRDGIPNPVNASRRQLRPGEMHRLDAQSLPSWVHGIAKRIG